MLAVSKEGGGHVCKSHGTGRQGTSALRAAVKPELLSFRAAGHCLSVHLGVLPLYRAETLAVLVLFQEFRHSCFSAPKAGVLQKANPGIVQKTKPGWSAVVKNKEVLILQEKNAENRSCERGNE